jgi:N-acyl-D-aspartate/D-glutamate deacylase
MLDLVIKGGVVVDGTGAPRRKADVGVRDGRIVVVGAVTDAARETIDAGGRIVAPGFIDVHTHYDAQVFWDHSLSPSSYHGVTTVVGGNCGFSIAPLSGRAEDSHYLLHMLARVEGMPVESLEQGVPWDWTSFGDYLSRLDGKLGLNAAFMVGHSALRRAVMGARATGEQATEAEIAAMQQLLRASLREGGLGFSSTISPTHNDADGKPVPSRYATDEELIALATVVGEFPGTTLEFLPAVTIFGEAQMERMTKLSVAAQRPLNWNLIVPNSANPDLLKLQLGAGDHAAKHGGKVVGLAIAGPITTRLNFTTVFVLDALPGWGGIARMSIEERMQALRDPAVREQLDSMANSEAAGVFRGLARWETYTIVEVFEAANKPLEGLTVAKIAEMQGKKPFDALLDLCLSENLKTSFAPPAFGGDDATYRLRAEVWQDWRTVIGGSDAGAHLDMIDTFAFSSQVLGPAVRERGLLSLERAVQLITQAPAELIGFTDRGTIREGNWADLVVFDADRIGCGPLHTRFDLPGGAGRLYAEAEGVGHVIVNGKEVVRDNRLTGVESGRVLRSGRDTYTVPLTGGPTRH